MSADGSHVEPAPGGSGLRFSIPGTGAGDSAAQYWANRQVETGNPLYVLPGLAASLWTPDTATTTAITLGTVGGGAVGVRVIDYVTKGYGFTVGRLSVMYELPSTQGRTIFNYQLSSGGRFALQTGKWAGPNTPWYKQTYFKLPGRTNHHWPWN